MVYLSVFRLDETPLFNVSSRRNAIIQCFVSTKRHYSVFRLDETPLSHLDLSIMNFNTANSTLRQLLGNGLSYHVPPFQRDYSWTEDEWDDLWQDMVDLFTEDGEPAHYMGYLVLQSSDNKRFDIIDGQQRITTLSIMILAGLGFLGDLIEAGNDADNNRKRREQLQSSYIGLCGSG